MARKAVLLLIAGLATNRALSAQLSPASSRTTTKSDAALRILSKARPGVRWDTATVIVSDLACDCHDDHAFLGHDSSKVLVGLVRRGGKAAHILEFGVSAARQDAICAEPASLASESLDYDLPATGFQRSRDCKGLVLSGGECDPIHIFWNRSTHDLSWWRE